MKYDFTSILDRRGKDAIAIDMVGAPGSSYPAPKEGFDIIPMWVADMNFPVPPSIQEAMIRRIQHPAFGYFSPREDYFNAIVAWQKLHNGTEDLRAEHIGYENGVLGGVVTALNVFCSRGDKVLLHAPTYVGFTGSLKNNGYDIVHSPLVLDENGIWRMDFEDMERRIVDNDIHAAIFCSPHNPCGRVWEQWEVEKAMELYKKHDVMVVSDEIWSDLIRPGYKHVPTQSVSEDAKMRTVALYPLQDLQSGRSHRQLPHHLQQDHSRSLQEGKLSGPLQHHERAFHACPSGCLWTAGLRMGGGAEPGYRRQCGFGL